MATRFEKFCAALIALMMAVCFIVGLGHIFGYMTGINVKDSGTGLEIVGAKFYIGMVMVGSLYGIYCIWDFTAFVYKKWGEKK